VTPVNVYARERLDTGALRHGAHPRRRAALEREVVLPGGEGAERDHGVEEVAQRRAPPVAVAPARRPRRVRLAEVGQRLDLEADTGVVLEQYRRAGEHHAGPGSLDIMA
jgi:hypothetical protein